MIFFDYCGQSLGKSLMGLVITITMTSWSRGTWCNHGDTSLGTGAILGLRRSPWVDGSVGGCKRGTITVNVGDRSSCWGAITVNVVAGWLWKGKGSPTLRFWTLVSTNLNNALEVDIHWVWELERLQNNIVIFKIIDWFRKIYNGWMKAYIRFTKNSTILNTLF